MTDVRDLFNIAKSVARQAGVFLAQAGEAHLEVDAQERHDVKLRADKVSESLIISGLQKSTGLAVLSEESGLIGGDLSGVHWIVDPLDGTINYSRKIPLCCVSVGLWDGDKPVCGVVYDFYRQELFTGMVGEGAWLNGVPVHVSTVPDKERGILVSGFPGRADLSDEAMRTFVDSVRSYQKLRWLGSAALSLAYVACGRADVYAESNIMLWDIAGALPILLAAGGVARMSKTEVKYCLNVSATNGLIAA